MRELYAVALAFTVRHLPGWLSCIIWFPVSFYQDWESERAAKLDRSFYA